MRSKTWKMSFSLVVFMENNQLTAGREDCERVADCGVSFGIECIFDRLVS